MIKWPPFYKTLNRKGKYMRDQKEIFLFLKTKLWRFLPALFSCFFFYSTTKVYISLNFFKNFFAVFFTSKPSYSDNSVCFTGERLLFLSLRTNISGFLTIRHSEYKVEFISKLDGLRDLNGLWGFFFSLIRSTILSKVSTVPFGISLLFVSGFSGVRVVFIKDKSKSMVSERCLLKSFLTLEFLSLL